MTTFRELFRALEAREIFASSCAVKEKPRQLARPSGVFEGFRVAEKNPNEHNIGDIYYAVVNQPPAKALTAINHPGAHGKTICFACRK
jgi:hypothetical protein